MSRWSSAASAPASTLSRVNAWLRLLALAIMPLTHAAAQPMATESRDPKQAPDADGVYAVPSLRSG